jgi:DNA-binding transcriptional MerR regulator
MAERPGNWTLTEAARLLGEPQHRLIYLCEKGVVEPDVQDAGGRGSSRRFSNRNLLEFAVALRLRELELPAAVIAAVVHVPFTPW